MNASMAKVGSRAVKREHFRGWHGSVLDAAKENIKAATQHRLQDVPAHGGAFSLSNTRWQRRWHLDNQEVMGWRIG
jgi:hypothetical protein